MRPPIIALAGAALLTSCSGDHGDFGHSADKAWVRLPAVAGRPGVAYFTLHTTRQPVALVKVTTPAAQRAELHESMMGAGGMTTMKPLDAVEADRRSDIVFAPGGKHVMLFGIAPDVKPGGTVKLTLGFAGEPAPLTIDAAVVGAADPAPQP